MQGAQSNQLTKIFALTASLELKTSLDPFPDLVVNLQLLAYLVHLNNMLKVYQIIVVLSILDASCCQLDLIFIHCIGLEALKSIQKLLFVTARTLPGLGHWELLL